MPHYKVLVNTLAASYVPDVIYRNLNGQVIMKDESALFDGSVEQVKVRVLPDGRMDRKNTARYLGRKVKTLAMWAMEGKGPRSVLVGGRRFYFKSDVDSFIRGEPAAPASAS